MKAMIFLATFAVMALGSREAVAQGATVPETGLGVGGVLFFLVAGGILYFLPALVGMRKRNSGAIFILNLLLGWTALGWIIALVWACCADTPAPVIQQPGGDEIAKLRARLEELERRKPPIIERCL